MFKIRLSILLLTSFFIFSCTHDQNNSSNQKYALAYIGGGYDGLLLKNYLTSSLKNLDLYDPYSDYEIKASITHRANLYITNIDNTSDREKVNTTLTFQVIKNSSNCQLSKEEINISQFYIYASADKFLSNQTALREIKKDNTESSVNRLIRKLININNKCDE